VNRVHVAHQRPRPRNQRLSHFEEHREKKSVVSFKGRAGNVSRSVLIPARGNGLMVRGGRKKSKDQAYAVVKVGRLQIPDKKRMPKISGERNEVYLQRARKKVRKKGVGSGQNRAVTGRE